MNSMSDVMENSYERVIPVEAGHFTKTFLNLLGTAGISINGNRPWDIYVHNPDFFAKVLAGGSLALGETYMEGWWDCAALDQFIHKILEARLDTRVNSLKELTWNILKARILNLQNSSRSYTVGRIHYDLGNELYRYMLDKRMTYSCGYWEDATNLDEAQEAKLELACRKLRLKEGMRVLDIGCGWGSFAKFAAEKYKANVVGITISREQAKFAADNCTDLPVEIRLADYRSLTGEFDRIVSIGMFEHVGYKNFGTYMDTVNRCLKNDGLFLLHTIGKNKSTCTNEPWLDKYIFPNGMAPSLKQISSATEKYFVIEDLHNIGTNYDKTLMAWHDNFNKNWDKISGSYDGRFYRMWKYYLLSCAGSFRARKNQVWQVVLSKNGVRGGYQRIY